MRNGARTRALQYAVALFLTIINLSAPARAGRNLLNNGDFVRGSGESVDGWRTDAWVLSAGTTEYKWIAPHHGEPAEIAIFSRRDNDARWVQGLSLGPGWYRISVEARTRNVLPFFTGASVSVLEDGIISQNLTGDTDWTPLSLYLRVGRRGADVDVALRLGGYMNLTRGRAWFRHARVVKVAAPPRNVMPVFDLSAIRKSETTGPVGHLWTLVAAFLALAAATATGWRMMAGPPVQHRRAEGFRGRKRA
ncbi:MAG: hypothetical protein JO166_17885 [Deltaproteobacteria bacterium]|nr:hypothetical protein [Deltaproteobacteria bacterium]